MIFISMPQQKCNLLLIIVFIILSTIALTGRSSAVEISCDGTSTADNPVVVSGLSDGTTSFSVGGSIENPYENLAKCYIKIVSTTPGASSTNVVFTFFHTERNRDKVTVYDGTNTQSTLATLSGDVLTPYVVHVSSGKDVLILFEADGTDHDGPGASTLQLGFNATFVDGNVCYNSCSGRGSCGADFKCTCNDKSSLADDCSVRATELVPGTTLDISGLAPGDWAYFYFELSAQSGWLVDLKDIGDASSDPYLMGAKNRAPRLYSKNYASWLDWYYDRTDVHYIRDSYGVTGTTYYVGVANYKARATENVDGKITLRTSSFGTYPCLLDCSSHGSCGTNGLCSCNNGWEGTGWNYPSTCSFEIKDVILDTTVQVPELRIGDWSYYKLNVNAEHANKRYLLVDMISNEIHADPILLLRKGQVPRLSQGLIPTYGGFETDYGDQDGFYTAIGSQSIIITPQDLDAGDWYIGVYNVWGYTGFEQESDASASFSLYVNMYAAGIPCPRFQGQFCNNQPSGSLNVCDFNTGKCICDDNYYGPDCSVYAQPIPLRPQVDETVTLSDKTLLVGYTEYFGVKINQTVITNGLNLVIDVAKRNPGDDSNPVLLARFNDVPYAVDSDQFDDHDFLSNYRHDDNHRIVLDNVELMGGVVVISLFNGAENLESVDLNYDITVSFKNLVSCPSGRNGQICSGRGSCNSELGRCNCDDGFTLDDCSALGIHHIEISDNGEATVQVVESDNKFIEPDTWAFYAIPIGCHKQGMHFDIRVDSASSGNSKPLLYARMGELPLMIDGMSDFRDYYSGMGHFSLNQMFLAEPCDSTNYCVLHPNGGYGSIFSTEGLRSAPDHGVDPGYWFLGIYNDVSASGAIKKYTLKFKQEFTYKTTQCAGTADCEEGFLGSQCRDMCPGIVIDSGYTNAPMPSEGSCNNFGECTYDSSSNNPSCQCESSHFGESCDIACPGIDPNSGSPCFGRGVCTFDSNATACSCQAGYAGEQCEYGCPDSCSGHGQCSIFTTYHGNLETTYEMCECDVGYTSANCADSCIDKCSSRGVCKSPTVPCDCFDGYIGDGCGLICPTDIDGQICSGNGTCTEEGGVAVCTCFEGRAGDICAEIADYSSSKTSGKLSGGAIAGYAFLCVGIVMILAIGFYVRRRYTKKITYYEKILADLPADDARIQSLIDEGGLEVPVDDNRIVPDADMQGSDKRRSSGMVPLESISM